MTRIDLSRPIPETPFEQFKFKNLFLICNCNLYKTHLLYGSLVLGNNNDSLKKFENLLLRKYMKDFIDWYKIYFKYRTYAPNLPIYKFYYI